VASSDADVLFVVDTTGSMGALDYGDGDERLAGVRADLAALVEEFSGAHFALIRFDSTAQIEVPWTTDRAAVELAIELLRQERTYYARGSRLNLPIAEIERLFPRAGGGDRYSVLVYVSDGEQTMPLDPRGPGLLEGFRRVSQLVDGGVVLGYGTPEGAPMRVYTGRRSIDSPMIYDPATGEDAISRIDEERLAGIAGALDVDYVHRTSDEGIAELADSIAEAAGSSLEDDGRADRPVYWVPVGGVLVLVLWQMAASLAELSASLAMVAPSGRRRRPGTDPAATPSAAASAPAGDRSAA
jgi:Ca-activated chloride channel family protein